MQLQNNRRFKKRYVLYAVIGLSVIGAIVSKPPSKGVLKTEQQQEIKEEVITIDARKLLKDYHANEVKADNNYKNKLVDVTGYVESITKDFTDDIIVRIEADENEFGINSINCYVKDEKAASELSKGDNISFTGRCEGMILGSVIVRQE